MVVVQHSAVPRATDDRGGGAVVVLGASLALDELTTEALVKTLGHVVGHELPDHVPQMSLAEEDELVETLVFDRLHEPLGVGIAIRTARWDLPAGTTPGPSPASRSGNTSTALPGSTDRKSTRL